MAAIRVGLWGRRGARTLLTNSRESNYGRFPIGLYAGELIFWGVYAHKLGLEADGAARLDLDCTLWPLC
jgi:hypothetical protein